MAKKERQFSSVNSKEEIEELFVLGTKASRELKDYKMSLKLFDKVEELHPENPRLPLYRMETYFLQKSYKKAYLEASKLVLLKHPSKQQSLRFGIHCALEVGLYAEAKIHSKTYLQKWSNDSLNAEVSQSLITEDNVSSLKFLFTR